MPIAQQIDTTRIDTKPWPGEAPASVDRHHNRPPIEEVIPLEFREALLADEPDFLVVLDANIAAADRAHAEDDQSLGKCGDLIKRYRALASHINATHKVAKQPYLDGGRLVDAERNSLLEKVEAAKAKVEGIGNAFVAKREAAAKAERDRIAAEERAAAERAAQAERARAAAEADARRAEQEAANEEERIAARARADAAAREAEQAMADAALAPAANAKVEPVRSDEGATVSSSVEWACEVEDYSKAVRFKAIASDPKVREAIDGAAKRLVKQTKGNLEIPGVRIWPVSKANFR